jgi:hypothetical protein
LEIASPSLPFAPLRLAMTQKKRARNDNKRKRFAMTTKEKARNDTKESHCKVAVSNYVIARLP